MLPFYSVMKPLLDVQKQDGWICVCDDVWPAAETAAICVVSAPVEIQAEMWFFVLL